MKLKKVNYKNSEERKGYLYRHIRLDTNEVFYIGISMANHGINIENGYSPVRAKNYSKRSIFWKNITNRTEYKIEILFKDKPKKFLLEKEKELIKLYGRRDLQEGTLVNLTDGGEGCCRSLANKGITRTPEHKLKISIANTGKRRTPEEKLKISKMRLGKKHNRPHSSRRKKIIQKTLSGEIIKIWNCATDCMSEGHNRSTINECCNLKHKSHHGFIWEFYTDNTNSSPDGLS